MSQSSDQHREAAAGRAVACAVLTISDTRTPETDKGGQLIRQLLTEGGHSVVDHAITKDEPQAIGTVLRKWMGRSDVQVILTTGGTGIARRDTTIEVVSRMLTVRMDGFGELFRMLSWDEVGAAAMLSRAIAGLVVGEEGREGGDTFVFSMPGSTNAVETAMKKLVVPELAHLVWERMR